MSAGLTHQTHYPLVHIVWYDHSSEDGWMEIEQAVRKWHEKALTVDSIGWLVDEDDKSYTIVNNIGRDGQGCMYMHILKGTVASFVVVSKPPKPPGDDT